MFENEQLLSEIFDSESTDDYAVVDLWPATKTPQCFLIKGPGINNLVVRLGALVEGTKVRNLQVTDTDVAVFIMSMSEKGNLTEFKGNLGASPIKTIIKIFDVVMGAISLTKVETILFRFSTKSIQGQKNQVKRIIDRLLVSKAKGRMVTLDELVEHSKKYAFIMAKKKNISVKDLPGADVDSSKYKKVDTSVGDVYIDDKTGKEASVAEVVSDSISKKLEKITTASVISKTKISRRVAMAAMYSKDIIDAPNLNKEKKEFYDRFNETHSVYKAGAKKSNISKQISKLDLKPVAIAALEETGHVGSNTFKDTLFRVLNREFSINKFSPEAETHVEVIINDVKNIFENANAKDLQSTMVQLANYVATSPILSKTDKQGRINVLKQLTYSIITGPIGASIIEAYKKSGDSELYRQYNDKQIDAIRDYTDRSFKYINNFLIGKPSSINKAELEMIDILDSAFAKGSTLEPGTILYRGQSMQLGQIKPMMDNKILYFKNYVSTSFLPMIYGKFTEAGLSGIDPDAQDMTDFTSADLNKSNSIDDDKREEISTGEYDKSVVISLGLIIKGADRVKVILPGTVSTFPYECEVILPRGTALRLVKITGEAAGKTSTNSMLIECEVIAAEDITESSEIIDGDLFLSEGKIEKIKPSFANIYRNDVLNEAAIPDNFEASELLCSILNINSMPEKFID